jgi:hypothetical protein
MIRWLPLAALTVIAAACSTPREPDRLVFGVSADRAASATVPADDAAMRRYLDARLNQICTLGYDTVKVDTIAAEAGQQLVDEQARCRDYSFSLF